MARRIFLFFFCVLILLQKPAEFQAVGSRRLALRGAFSFFLCFFQNKYITLHNVLWLCMYHSTPLKTVHV